MGLVMSGSGSFLGLAEDISSSAIPVYLGVVREAAAPHRYYPILSAIFLRESS